MSERGAKLSVGGLLWPRHTLRTDSILMADVTIYHNPRCSKSRETLELLRSRGLQPRVIEYLNDPPDAATLERLLDKLNLEPAGRNRPILQRGGVVVKFDKGWKPLSDLRDQRPNRGHSFVVEVVRDTAWNDAIAH